MSASISTLKSAIKSWYIPLLVGIIFIAFGIYTFTVPLATYLSLTILFSTSFIVSGLFEIAFAVQNSKSFLGWGWFLVSGLLSFGLGIYMVLYPEVAAAILPSYIGFTMLFKSFQLLGFAFELKNLSSKSWGNLALLSALGILFSFLLLANPVFTGLSLVTLTALVFIAAGIAGIVLSLELKKVKDVGTQLRESLSHK
ncbi:MAG: rane protein [Sphingobacterium sp.]|jgi:uncharacterized membrane protein HdeD (DUF308 family)|nr:rane protein [Sphingobacterium sp.]